jgi:hypothetical protein
MNLLFNAVFATRIELDDEIGDEMIQKDVMDILERFKREYGERYGIVEIGLFGSFARGEAQLESDLDVFVKTRTPNPFILVHIKETLEDLVGRRVDIVRLRENMNPFLKEQIEKDARYF